MAVPISQMWTVASYILKKRMSGQKKYPLVLMLEPLFRCNLACAGCGKVQYPPHILKKQLSPEECFAAVEECGVPMVSLPGGEPLLHPQIVEIVNGLIARKKYIYLCTNALELKKRLHEFTPSKYLTFSVHLDGQREHHDMSVCREGGYDIAVEGIKEAVRLGFRVTTNATFFDGTDPNSVRSFFDEVMSMGVEGIVLSPGYSYEKAPDQQHFLGRAKTRRLFRAILSNRKKSWKFNMSPLFLEFLMGKRNYECTAWGSPAYNIFGWQKPCYLLQDGYADSFQELLDTTNWDNYGTASGNPKCANCMVSCGYEPTAVSAGFGSLSGFFAMAKAAIFNTYQDKGALDLLNNRSFAAENDRLIKIESIAPAVHSTPQLEETARMSQPVHVEGSVNVDELEVVDGRAYENLEGWVPELASEEEVREALEKAFDYRGDISLTLRNGDKVEAYVFNRVTGSSLADSYVQYFASNAPDKRKASYSEIARIEFSGKDRAAGKHWEAWIKKYNEKKAVGETNIALEPEALD